MTSQDYRVQESRYRPDDYADEQRRYDEARRYQSGRRDQQGQAGYGRGRDFGPRDEYGRDADNFGRRWSEPSGHGRYEEEHFGGERSLAERDYYDRGREPRNYGNPELEGYGSRPAGQYQVGGYRGGERDYGVSRNPRLAAYGNDPRDDYRRITRACGRAGYRTAVTNGPGGLATIVTSMLVTTASDRKLTSAPMNAFARTSPII
jgi:hypothetical protein